MKLRRYVGVAQSVPFSRDGLHTGLLIRNERNVDLERLCVMCEQFPPLLSVLLGRILLFETDLESSLKLEEEIQIQEYVVYYISRQHTILFQLLLELLQILEVVDVISFRLNKFVDDLLPNRLSLGTIGVYIGGRRLSFQQQALLLQHIEDAIHNFCDLVRDPS